MAFLKKRIAAHEGRFALAVDSRDVGAKDSGFSFIAASLHYRDENFKLVSEPIGFEVFEWNSDKYTLMNRTKMASKALLRLLDRFGLKDRIVCTTSAIKDLPVVSPGEYRKQSGRIVQFPSGDNNGCLKYIIYKAARSFLDDICFNPSEAYAKKKLKALKKTHYGEYERRTIVVPKMLRSIAHALNNNEFFRKEFATVLARRRPQEAKKGIPEFPLDMPGDELLSSEKMLDQLLKYESEIDAVLGTIRFLSLTRRTELGLKAYQLSYMDWAYAHSVRTILRILIHPLTSIEDSKDISCGMVLSLISDTQTELNVEWNRRACTMGRFSADAICNTRSVLHRYFTTFCISDERALYFSMTLDPRYHFSDVADVLSTRPKTSEFLSDFCDVYDVYRGKHETTEEAKSRRRAQKERKRERQAWGVPRYHFPYGQAPDSDLDSDSGSDLDSAAPSFPKVFETRQELCIFLREPVERQESVAEYYQKRKEVYPIIYRMAKDFLAIPPYVTLTEPIVQEVVQMKLEKGQDETTASFMQKYVFLRSRGFLKDMGDSKNNEGEAAKESPQNVEKEEKSKDPVASKVNSKTGSEGSDTQDPVKDKESQSEKRVKIESSAEGVVRGFEGSEGSKGKELVKAVKIES